MTELLGFIGIIITLLVIIPASLSALIRVFYHPVNEIVILWTELIDILLEVIHTVKSYFGKLK